MEPWQRILLEKYPGLWDYDPYQPEGCLFDLLIKMYGDPDGEEKVRGFSFDDARVVSIYRIKEAQAHQFLDQHPLAPRRWRQIWK